MLHQLMMCSSFVDLLNISFDEDTSQSILLTASDVDTDEPTLFNFRRF